MWPNFHTFSYTQKFHYQQVTQCFYLLFTAPAYFGHTFWLSSGSYEFGQCVCVCVYIYVGGLKSFACTVIFLFTLDISG